MNNVHQMTEFICDYCAQKAYMIRNDIMLDHSIDSLSYNIIECSHCNLISLYPQPSEQEILDFYSDYGSKKDRFKDEEIRKECVYEPKLVKLKKYAKGPRLLDIGAGLGTFSFMAKNAGFDVTGIELSPEQCRFAKERYGLDLLNINIFENSQSLGKYDVIHLHHVLEHLICPMELFKIMKKLLNNDGLLLIEVPYQLKKIQDYYKNNNGIKTDFIIDHLFYFTPKSLKKYIIYNSFKILEFNQQRQVDINYKFIVKQKTKYFKYLIHKLMTRLYMPNGYFLEYYCRKK